MMAGDFSSDLLGMMSPEEPNEGMIHATLDDVGTCGNDGMSAVVGYVAYKPKWDNFNWAWKKTLTDFSIDYLHTSEYLFRYPRVGDGPPTDAKIFVSWTPSST